MDISLLSKMIGELILHNDQVGLPGIGTFVAEMVPASFSDKGYTINPPYRRLNFYPARLEEDVLAEFYAKANGIDIESAKESVNKFLSELRVVLIDRRAIVLPGLGRLRATKENNFFFVPDESLDIYPEGYGLPAISLKTHVETPEEIALSVSNLAKIIEARTPKAEEPIAFDIIPQEPPVPQPAPVAAEPEPVPQPAPEQAPLPVPEPQPAAQPQPEPRPEPRPEPKPEPKPLPRPEPQLEEPELIVPPKQSSRTAPRQSVRPEFRSDPKSDEKFDLLFDSEKGAGPKLEPGPRKWPWWVIPAIIAGIAFILLCTFVVLAALAPDFIDTILYTPEELDIINM